MSIETHKGNKNNNLSTSFSNSVAASNFAMEPVEPVQIDPIKPAELSPYDDPRKRFHVLLMESWHKGIRNKGHSNSNEDKYSCPMLCVSELLGIQLGDLQYEKSLTSHKQINEKLKADKKMVYITTKLECPRCQGYKDEWSDDGKWDEPYLGWHLASSHSIPNNKVAEMLAKLFTDDMYQEQRMLEEHKEAIKKELEAKRNQPKLEAEPLGRLRDEKGRYIKRQR